MFVKGVVPHSKGERGLGVEDTWPGSPMRSQMGPSALTSLQSRIMNDGASHLRHLLDKGLLRNLEVRVVESQKYKAPGCVWLITGSSCNPEFTGGSVRE